MLFFQISDKINFFGQFTFKNFFNLRLIKTSYINENNIISLLVNLIWIDKSNNACYIMYGLIGNDIK